MRRLPLLLLLLPFAGSRVGHAAVLQVPDPYPLIQSALNSSANGDTVLVAPGHYHERLVIPNRDLTLGSHTLLTGDTLFILQTIIDGDSLGQVIRTNPGSYHNRFVLNGFTIRGGVGYQEHGGGIDILDDSNVLLSNLYFEHNYSTSDGACIYINGAQRVEMRNIQGRENHSLGPVLKLIGVYVERTAILDGMRFVDLDCGLLSFGARTDTCIVRNVNVSSSTSKLLIGAGMSNANENSYQEYSNIIISDIQWQGYHLVNLSGSSQAIIKNIQLIDNTRIGTRDQDGHMLRTSARGWAICDSLVFRGNRGAVAGATGGKLQVGGFAPDYTPVHGVIRNLIMEDNVLGDSTYTPWGTDWKAMLTTEAYCIDGAKVRNNTVIATPGPDSPAWGELAANLIRTRTQLTDSSIFRNMLFENNLVIDRDDNDALQAHWANEGRCLFIGPNYCDYFLADSLVFDRNLQPNLCAELPYGGEFSDGIDVGSVFQIGNDWENDVAPPRYFRNLIFRGNQDGGFRARDEVDLRLSNVQMIDMHRQGLDLQAQRVELDNVLIDGCEPYAPIPIRSEQMPLRLEVTDSSVVRNCTIINCTTPYVVMAGVTPYEEPRDPIVTFENCLFADNQFTRFEALVPQYDWPGWDSYRPGRFNHCLLPEAPDYGTDNLIGLDPLFDTEWGAPYLSPLSPCVDTGDPDSTRNDREDPGQPGFALWPSLGGLRNDIGFTGGPHAAVFDTNWVALPTWEPRLVPRDFSLGAPWPNPFNPATRFPFTLTRPLPVRLVVHNLLGQEVAVLVNRVMPAGAHQAVFGSHRLASGVYLVTLEAAGRAETRTVTLLR